MRKWETQAGRGLAVLRMGQLSLEKRLTFDQRLKGGSHEYVLEKCSRQKDKRYEGDQLGLEWTSKETSRR